MLFVLHSLRLKLVVSFGHDVTLFILIIVLPHRMFVSDEELVKNENSMK